MADHQPFAGAIRPQKRWTSYALLVEALTLVLIAL